MGNFVIFENMKICTWYEYIETLKPVQTVFIVFSLEHTFFSTRRRKIRAVIGSGCVQNLMGRVGSGQEVFKARGSGQVGPKTLNSTGRLGSGRVKNSALQTSRVGSGQEVMRISRVGSGHDPREMGHSWVGPV